MATNRSRPSRQRFPGFTGKLIVDTYRGQVRARSWPRKRGLPKDPLQAQRLVAFQRYAALAKLAAPSQVITATDTTKGTGLYPRDLLFMAMAGNLGDLVREDGRVIRKRKPRVYPVTFQGVKLRFLVNTNIPTGGDQTLAWPLPEIDTAAMWSAGEPKRITIPGGINVIRLTGAVQRQFVSSFMHATIWKNDATRIADQGFSAAQSNRCTVDTGPLTVQEGDYFTVRAWIESGNPLEGDGNTWFSATILDAGG